MQRTAVFSSNIASMGYDAASKTLEVEFKGSTQNKVWTYTPVSQETYDEIVTAESVGRAFNALVKCDPMVIGSDVTEIETTEAF